MSTTSPTLMPTVEYDGSISQMIDPENAALERAMKASRTSFTQEQTARDAALARAVRTTSVKPHANAHEIALTPPRHAHPPRSHPSSFPDLPYCHPAAASRLLPPSDSLQWKRDRQFQISAPRWLATQSEPRPTPHEWTQMTRCSSVRRTAASVLQGCDNARKAARGAGLVQSPCTVFVPYTVYSSAGVSCARCACTPHPPVGGRDSFRPVCVISEMDLIRT